VSLSTSHYSREPFLDYLTALGIALEAARRVVLCKAVKSVSELVGILKSYVHSLAAIRGKEVSRVSAQKDTVVSLKGFGDSTVHDVGGDGREGFN